MGPLLRVVIVGAVCVVCVAEVTQPHALPADTSQVGAGIGSRDARVNPYAEAMAAFRDRLDAYLRLRRELASDMPEVTETGDPAKISLRQQQLGLALAKARVGTKAGDLFGPDLTPHLLTIVADDLRRRSPEDRQALNGEIPANVRLQVNHPYPTTLPLLSVPANLLAKMPALPEELEYRLVHRRLLLRDRDANLIIDILIPAPPARTIRPR